VINATTKHPTGQRAGTLATLVHMNTSSSVSSVQTHDQPFLHQFRRTKRRAAGAHVGNVSVDLLPNSSRLLQEMKLEKISTTSSSSASSARIVGAPVAPLLPSAGEVRVLIVGEAPGPRGADKSGVPFFGDAAGKHLYVALRKLGAVALSQSVDEMKWDGALLRSAGFNPIATQISLTNAFNCCPTDDGRKFRAPTRDELGGEPNTTRLRQEIDALRTRGLTGIVTLGKVATRTMQAVVAEYYADAIPVYSLPHPSAQGLLSMAPERGRGARMADLQAAWMEQCMRAIRAAGFEESVTTGKGS